MKGSLVPLLTKRFQSDFKRLSVDIQKKALECIEDFSRDPLPESRRPHRVNPGGEVPKVFSMDVTSNKKYKLTFQFDGDTAILRRIGSHDEIDRAP